MLWIKFIKIMTRINLDCKFKKSTKSFTISIYYKLFIVMKNAIDYIIFHDVELWAKILPKWLNYRQIDSNWMK